MDGKRPRDFTLSGGQRHRRRRRLGIVVWIALAVGVAGALFGWPVMAAVALGVALIVSFYVNHRP